MPSRNVGTKRKRTADPEIPAELAIEELQAKTGRKPPSAEETIG